MSVDSMILLQQITETAIIDNQSINQSVSLSSINQSVSHQLVNQSISQSINIFYVSAVPLAESQCQTKWRGGYGLASKDHGGSHRG